MLEVRIKRRLRALEFSTYRQYCEYIFDPHQLKEEITPLIDVVTTNKTDFFREASHFDYLVQQILPERAARCGFGTPFLVWSAGCSTGEEPYTLAMVLSEYAQAHPGFHFRILATDISTTVLSKASLAVYSKSAADPIPVSLRKKCLMVSRGPGADRVRIVPELRRLVEFRYLNFMDADYKVSETFDAIFCRNVLIYFDRPTQESVLAKLAHHLASGGHMFVGHSETLHDMSLPLSPIAPALYRKCYVAAR